MDKIGLDKITSNLATICNQYLLEEKWLIAPNIRIGYQWLDQITKSGTPSTNVRVKTLRGAVFELALPKMQSADHSYISGIKLDLIISNIFANIKSQGELYLTKLELSPGLINSLSKTIIDMRLSGINSVDIVPKSFEVDVKGEELKTILHEYEQILKSKKYLDYADTLKLAIQQIKHDSTWFKTNHKLIAPIDIVDGLRGLEKTFWESIPSQNRLTLEIDRYDEIEDDDIDDMKLLGLFNNPKNAPSPKKDGTVEMFRAIGEVNEVREVIRRCLQKGIPFDDVEIIHTDYTTYVPIIYELGFLIDNQESEGLPITFTEGIPSRYSRPGKALLSWLDWLNQDFSQAILVQMIEEDLLNIDIEINGNINYSTIINILRELSIGRGRDRYIAIIEASIKNLETKLTNSSGKVDKKEDDLKNQQNDLQIINILKILQRFISDLLSISRSDLTQKEILINALLFLNKYARSKNQLDEYSLHGFQRSIGEFVNSLKDNALTSYDAYDWLSKLPEETRVGGLGPRPGTIFVSSLETGGHSGRQNTFIIGMDENRFPGAGIQDPILLDEERGKLSPQLTTSSSKLSNKIHKFSNLLLRLRGKVTLSYSSRSLINDTEMVPSPIMISCYRILTDDKEGDFLKMTNWLSPPVSFAPDSPDSCKDLNEWWLSKMCGLEKIKEPEKLIMSQFPHLGRGLEARKARESDIFTEYDGYVPSAGQDYNPTKEGGSILSASRLETLAACPLEYFFKYILRIEPAEEYIVDPNIWIDPLEKGEMLHDVFRCFMAEIHKQGIHPKFERDIDKLEQILISRIELKEKEVIPPSQMVLDREIADLKNIIRIFLKREEDLTNLSYPSYFEVAIGIDQDGEVTSLDSVDPVEIKLNNGRRVFGRGKIDRIDEVIDSQRKLFNIWDYKTGSSWKYRQKPPFWAGRCIQNSFYLLLLENRLKDVHPGAAINNFGYFFVSSREHGERIYWEKQQLEEGKEVLDNLCQMLSNGCFPFTDEIDDAKNSDYLLAFGDLYTMASETKKKLENNKNKSLEPFRKLRGYV